MSTVFVFHENRERLYVESLTGVHQVVFQEGYVVDGDKFFPPHPWVELELYFLWLLV